MSVINPDEWSEVRTDAMRFANYSWSSAMLILLCLLDLARYGIRWGTPEPEWVRCVDQCDYHCLTANKTYRVAREESEWVIVVNDNGWRCAYPRRLFVSSSADEAKMTIEVPVGWARYQVHGATTGITSLEVSEGDAVVRDSCRNKLTEIGLL